MDQEPTRRVVEPSSLRPPNASARGTADGFGEGFAGVLRGREGADGGAVADRSGSFAFGVVVGLPGDGVGRGVDAVGAGSGATVRAGVPWRVGSVGAVGT